MKWHRLSPDNHTSTHSSHLPRLHGFCARAWPAKRDAWMPPLYAERSSMQMSYDRSMFSIVSASFWNKGTRHPSLASAARLAAVITSHTKYNSPNACCPICAMSMPSSESSAKVTSICWESLVQHGCWLRMAAFAAVTGTPPTSQTRTRQLASMQACCGPPTPRTESHCMPNLRMRSPGFDCPDAFRSGTRRAYPVTSLISSIAGAKHSSPG